MSEPKAECDAIRAGTVFVDKIWALPESLPLGGDVAGAGWVGIRGNPDHRHLESILSAAGWRFFFLAHSIKTSAFAFDRCAALQKAIRRLVSAAKDEQYNALEVDRTEECSFWGISYARLSAHPRNIKEHMVWGYGA